MGLEFKMTSATTVPVQKVAEYYIQGSSRKQPLPSSKTLKTPPRSNHTKIMLTEREKTEFGPSEYLSNAAVHKNTFNL